MLEPETQLPPKYSQMQLAGNHQSLHPGQLSQ